MDFEGRARIHTHLEMAPLIDVVFLLLIFFMLTTTFMVQEAVELQIPQSETGGEADPSALVIVLSHSDLTFNGESVSLEELKNALLEPLRADSDRAVTLMTDAEMPVQRILQVMDRIRSAGGRNVALATEGMR
jgi:biopolymer transport protein ExbD